MGEARIFSHLLRAIRTIFLLQVVDAAARPVVQSGTLSSPRVSSLSVHSVLSFRGATGCGRLHQKVEP